MSLFDNTNRMKTNLDLIVEDLLKTKKFSRLGKDYVEIFLLSFLNKNKFKKERMLIRNLDYRKLVKNAAYKRFLKIVKRVLHATYGVFQVKDAEKREAILNLMKKAKDEDTFKNEHYEMLHTHSSSRERMEYYPEVYRKIFSICGKPNRVIDIGCGMNPFSLIFIGFNNFDYVCFEFVSKDIELVNEYFKYFGKKIGINGRAEFYNAFKNDYPETAISDVCFFFKMVDVIEYGSKRHRRTEAFIKGINSKFIVVSFATKTVSAKIMNNPRRKWFEVMLNRLGHPYDYFEIDNECFYVVKKSF